MLIKVLLGSSKQASAQPVQYVVIGGDRVIVTEAATGKSPHKIGTKIIGKDLYIYAEGSDEVSAVLHDYTTFGESVQIVGIDAGGAYADYALTGAGIMELGAEAALPAGEEPFLSTNGMIGIAILAAAGGIAAAAAGGSDDKIPAVDSTAPAAAVIDTVATDNIVNASENTNLIISGTGEIGATVTLAVAGQSAVVDGSGNWSITVADAAAVFGQGEETLSVTQTDGSGNVSVAGTRSITVDTVAPSLAIADDEPMVTANIEGGDILYTFTFSEAVAGFDAGDVNIAHGGVKTFTKVSDTVYTLGVTPEAGYEGDMTVGVPANGYTDLAGNNGQGDVTGTQTIDMKAPVFLNAQTDSAADSITLVYDSVLENVNLSNAGNFSVDVSGVQYLNGAGILALGLDAGGQEITLSLNGIDILSTDTVQISYADTTGDTTPAIQDLAGNDAMSFGWYTAAVI